MKRTNTPYTGDELYRAHLTRDYRFDGKFFVAVKTTKIYCRPTCPARKAKRENVEFFTHTFQAEEAGYRPCIRCRPESAPGSPAWLGTSAIVRRAIRIIETEALDAISVSVIAAKLGITERWFRALFKKECGATPQAYILDRKLSLAKNLLENGLTSVTEVAFSAGFSSIRRFNDAFKQKFKVTPSRFQDNHQDLDTYTLYFRYRPPLAWQALLNFLDQRALTGVEVVKNNAYYRMIRYQGAQGWFKASLGEDHKMRFDVKLNKPVSMLDFSSRVRALFDLDADPHLIMQDLQQDKQLSPLLSVYAGLRIPGAWDGFELAVRAIIGQKISVKAAWTVLNRLVERCGERNTLPNVIGLTHCFPTPRHVLDNDLSDLGLTQAKISALKSLAQAVEGGFIIFDGTQDYDLTCKRLLAIKGIGPWTVQYIAMRALCNPDAFPETDLEIKKQVQARNLTPALWRPWRAYAAILLFTVSAEETK